MMVVRKSSLHLDCGQLVDDEEGEDDEYDDYQEELAPP